MRVRMAGLAWVLVTLACSGGGGGSSSGGSSSGGSSGGSDSVGDFYFSELIPEMCAFEERCVDTRGRQWASAAACQDYYNGMDAYYALVAGKGFRQILDESFTLVRAQADACKASFASAGCSSDPFNGSAVCQGAVHPRQAIPVGGDCTTGGADFSGKDCDTGLHCVSRTDKPDCRRCVQPVADGQPCQEGGDCQSYSCNNNVCAPATQPSALNQSCESTYSCVGNLHCVGASGGHTCKPAAAENEACENGNPPCRYGLYCDGSTHVCKPQLADGTACDALTTQCLHLCKLTSATGAAGVCAPYTDVPSSGQPCAVVYASETAPVCASGLRAAYTASSGSFSCTCSALLTNGQSCQSGTECQGGVCLPNDQCGAAQPDGQHCNTDAHCTSGWCNYGLDGGTCATPMCG